MHRGNVGIRVDGGRRPGDVRDMYVRVTRLMVVGRIHGSLQDSKLSNQHTENDKREGE